MNQGSFLAQEFMDPVIEMLSLDTIEKQSFLDLLPVAVYTCNTEGKITFFNKVAADLWGYRPDINEEHLQFWSGFNLLTLDGKSIPPDKTPMAIAFEKGEFIRNVEVLVERRDGSRFYAAVNIDQLFDEKNNVVGTVNIFQDISNQKKAEIALKEIENKYLDLAAKLESKIEEKTEALKNSEERYHRMVEEVEDYAIILLDPDGIIQNWNRGAEKIKGYKENEIVGKSFINFYLPEDRENGLPLRLLGEARKKGKAIHEGWRLRKDGTIFWGSIVLTALHDDNNNVTGFTKVTRDLTERKEGEDQLKEYSNQLEFQNQELEQFAYAASHDMKEPLRKICMYNSYIADDASNRLNDKSKEYLKRSVASAKRLTALIEDLLVYSKTTTSLEGVGQIDMGEVIEEVIMHHKDDFEEKRIRVQYTNLPVVFGVRFQLMQLMENLISNSVKYKHPDRDGIISISSEIVKGSQIIQRDMDPSKQYYKISVIDNGIGFESQNADKIFDIFQRLNNLPGASGSGIGLAICKRIVQNHKGVIKATGKAGKGAQFEIYLPEGA